MEQIRELWHVIMTNESSVKLIIAAVIGLLIGLEREMKNKPAGMKTALIITTASCLLTVISIESAQAYAVSYSNPMDPLRLPAQIVSGIGFLGGGAILRRNNDVISGLTTAALIWASGGLGIAIGVGYYGEAILSIILIMIGVEVIPYMMKKVGPRRLSEDFYRVKCTCVVGTNSSEVMDSLVKKGMTIARRKKVKLSNEGVVIELYLKTGNYKEIETLQKELLERDGVKGVELEQMG